MFFLMSVTQGKKELDFHQTIVCKKCGRLAYINIFMTYSCFSLFFIPLFKWNKVYYAVSSCCGTIFAIPDDIGKAVERGDSVTVHEEDMHIVNIGNGRAAMECPDCGCMLMPEYEYCPKCGRRL